ncbi:BglG family transcription antiterminator [Alkalicella caledoniensis]|uniref:BglG family transcription antiterminator n=1 Tax=Alkalicella caledoniensis TaxID=2731377 RepID=A0A7G9W7R1_ALKCA|nr:BglG family transcription antiterminator [Alkalicella caledoniensis]QNO14723.1 BglG family transcription antiterminator [Alkalicella caledoniensis]
MIKLTSRSKQILAEILNVEEYITFKSIGKKIDVSSRTVLREMDHVEDWVVKEGYKLTRKPSAGIKIKATQDQKKELLAKLEAEEIQGGYSPIDRQHLMLFKLLITNEPIKTYFFTHEFEVSEGTISNDLDQIEAWIKKYNLKIVRKPGYGIYIDGRERDKRQALTNLLYKTTDENQLYQWIMDRSKEKIKGRTDDIRNEFLDLIDKEIISKVQKVIDSLEEQLEEHLSDNAYMGLIIHLSIAIQRIRNDEEIKMDNDFLSELQNCPEYISAEKISKAIGETFDIDVPKDEIGYITMHLKGAKVRKLLSDDSDVLFSNKTFEIVKEIIDVASVATGFGLHDDQELLLALLAHLEPAINRLTMGLEIRNPLLERIKEEYSEIYQLSSKCGKVLEKKLGLDIPESEIGYLAMHLGAALENYKTSQKTKYRVVVACASGLGSSRLLSSRIEKEFSDVQVLDIISTINIEDYSFNEDVDFVISTVDFEVEGIKVAVVNPLLNPEDKKKIQRVITELKKTNNKKDPARKVQQSPVSNLEDKLTKMMDYSKCIMEILKGFNFYEEVNLTSKNEVVEFIANDFDISQQEKQTLEKEFEAREMLGSTIIPQKKIMVLHCRTTVLSTLVVKFLRLKEEIIVDNKQVKYILILIAPKNSPKTSIETISHVSKSLIEDKRFLDSFLTGTHGDLYRGLVRILEGFYDIKSNE